MRKEIEDWLKQAKADLLNARKNLRENAYYLCSFLCQQAVEKALKALHLKKFRKEVFGHRIIQFARKLRAPEELMPGIKELQPEWVVARYPNAAGGPPVEIYTRQKALRNLRVAAKVLKWVERRIGE